MLISRYSAPDFNPYGDTSPTGADTDWPAPRASGPLAARVSLPGSKSLTNRELVLSALAGAPSRLRSPLHSRDTNLMVQALRSLGVGIDEVAGAGRFGPDWVITPAEELLGSTSIDCGLAGTVMRFLPPVAALALGPTQFDGDEAARRRPMATTITSLRALGVDIDSDGRTNLPFTVHGTGRVEGGDVTIDASTSSQFVSGLLLAAVRFEKGLHLTHSGERLPSMPHIEMTIAALAARGVAVAAPAAGEWMLEPQSIAGLDVSIEPDLSNAAPFLAAALVTGGSVSIGGWPSATTQVGALLLDLLPLFGAEVARDGDRVTVTACGSGAGNSSGDDSSDRDRDSSGDDSVGDRSGDDSGESSAGTSSPKRRATASTSGSAHGRWTPNSRAGQFQLPVPTAISPMRISAPRAGPTRASIGPRHCWMWGRIAP